MADVASCVFIGAYYLIVCPCLTLLLTAMQVVDRRVWDGGCDSKPYNPVELLAPQNKSTRCLISFVWGQSKGCESIIDIEGAG